MQFTHTIFRINPMTEKVFLIFIFMMWTASHVIGETVTQDEIVVQEENKNPNINSSDSATAAAQGKAKTIYKVLFSKQREEQIQALKRIDTVDSNTRRYELIELMLKQLFEVVRSAKNNITQWNIAPTDPLPENETHKLTLSSVYENTALFTHLVLQDPEIVHDLFDRKKSWKNVLIWCVDFCNESRIFEGSSAFMLNLMAQEMKLKPNLGNLPRPDLSPSEDELLRVYAKYVINRELKQQPRKTVLKKKKIKKGPRLSNHVEL